MQTNESGREDLLLRVRLSKRKNLVKSSALLFHESMIGGGIMSGMKCFGTFGSRRDAEMVGEERARASLAVLPAQREGKISNRNVN